MEQPSEPIQGPPRWTARRRHAAQRGLTLIETIVAVAILATGVVGVAAGIASIQKLAGINQDQSQLQLVMRQLADWTRNSSSTTCSGGAGACPNLPYATCATTAAYQSEITAAESAGALNPGGVTPRIVSVTLGNSATRTAAGTSTPVFINPLPTPSPPQPNGCSAAGTCPGATCVGDWGTQEIVIQVSDSARSLTRTVWKSNGW